MNLEWDSPEVVKRSGIMAKTRLTCPTKHSSTGNGEKEQKEKKGT